MSGKHIHGKRKKSLSLKRLLLMMVLMMVLLMRMLLMRIVTRSLATLIMSTSSLTPVPTRSLCGPKGRRKTHGVIKTVSSVPRLHHTAQDEPSVNHQHKALKLPLFLLTVWVKEVKEEEEEDDDDDQDKKDKGRC